MESWSTCTSNCMNNETFGSQDQGLPPGFRFHPTDEELITHYLANKIDNPNFSCHAVSDADLNKSEPWELPGKARMGEKEWYFFSAKDRKYPTGMRTNRATEAGYWKATGKDREVMSSGAGRMVGMKKTLVFYRGRAPKGIKTNWVMHEYRTEGHKLCSRASSSHSKDEWVVCRIFHKSPGGKKMGLSELRQGSLVTNDNGETLYTASLPALLDSPAPAGSSGGGRSDQDQSMMLNALLNYNNSVIKSEMTPYNNGSSIFSSTSMTSLVARSGIPSSINLPYTSTISTPSLQSSIGTSHMSHNIGTNVVVVSNQRASYPHSRQGASSPNPFMSNTFNNHKSPPNVGTSNDNNNQHNLSAMQYVNNNHYPDPLLSITPTSLAPPDLSRLPSDLDTFWLYSDRI